MGGRSDGTDDSQARDKSAWPPDAQVPKAVKRPGREKETWQMRMGMGNPSRGSRMQ